MSADALLILWWYWSAGTSLGPSLDNIIHVRASNWHVRI